MTGWMSRAGKSALVGVLLVVLSLFVVPLAADSAGAAGSRQAMHSPSGVGSCTLKGWNPNLDPNDAKNLPEGHRPQSYRPDNYNCTGAKFAAPGVEFARFPQPHNFHLTNREVTRSTPICRGTVCTKTVFQPVQTSAQASSPLAPYFPPFTHFVVLYRENHTFDDYLGDCATTVIAGCNGAVQSTNHISSVPNLHTLAKTYALDDSYSTGTQPPSGPNHWWLFSGQSASSSQQQSYPAATGTQFDRFLGSATGPSGEGTNACTAQTGTGTGTSPYTMSLNGDFYWMLSSGSGYWRDPATGKLEVLPVNRPGTNIPEELHYNEYTCSNQNISDATIANDYLSSINTNGLAAYNYVELFNDHPGTYQDIPGNDSATNQIVSSIMGNPAYKDNTLIVVTEDDTQNGNNGPDHVSNTYRVPLVVIGSPLYVKQHYLSHVAYTTSNVIAAMERVMQNVKSGIIDPNNNLGLSTFPMTTNDQTALGDPLEDFWVQGSTPLSATASGTPTTGNAPLNVSFSGSATGGTAPYSYSWNFGDGSATSTTQNPSHTYSAAGNYTATLTVTDSASPAHTATSSVTLTVNAVGAALQATASATPTSGQVPLNVSFSGAGTGGTPPYSYSWSFGDGSATSTTQNPTHTYNNAGTYTATLTVTDSASPAHTASASVTITASPIAGTVPGAPTGLTAGPGDGRITLSWTAPSSNGGLNITSYKVYRGTSSGGETLLASGGCSGLGAVLTCTDTGLTNGTAYYYKVSAVNSIGEGAQSNEANATPTANSLLSQNFDASNSIPSGWTATGLWRVGSNCLGAASAPNSLQFNSTSTCTYNPLRSSGYATSPAFDISSAAAPSLTLNTKYQVESYSGHTDQMKVQAKTATGSWTTLWTRDSTNPAQTTFAPVSLDLSAFKSTGTQIRFSFDSIDTYPRSHPGWAVDDVAVHPGSGSVTVTNPGSQSVPVGSPTNLQISATDTAGGTLTYAATGLPTGLAINASTGLISGTPTTTGTYSTTVSASDSTGPSGSASFSWTVNPASSCTPSQLLGNPGFETGSAAPWSATSGVIANNSTEPPHSGSWDAWLDGYGTTHTDTLSQSITLPSGCSTYQFSFWLHIDTAETSTTTAYDTLKVQVLNSSGTVLATLATYSNLNHNTGYTQKSFSLASYAGQAIALKFTGTEDNTNQTSFVIDDTAANVS